MVMESPTIRELVALEVEFINYGYSLNDEAGATCLLNSISSFKKFILFTQGETIFSMSIDYRTFIVGLLISIEKQYLDSAMKVVLLNKR